MGHLWNSLADYYIRSGLFERARDIYEEAIQTVLTVRDFTQVFDAYAQFEELALSKKMEEVAELEQPQQEDEVEIELRMGRFEGLMDRRPLLLNSVLLRQNPHNVPEWQKRVSDLPPILIDALLFFSEGGPVGGQATRHCQHLHRGGANHRPQAGGGQARLALGKLCKVLREQQAAGGRPSDL